MKLLTKKQQESYKNANICYICKYSKGEKYREVRDHCHYTGEQRGAVYSICNLEYSVPKRTPIVSHNGSNYGYHFIIKELTKEF